MSAENTDPDCIFCKIVAGEVPAEVIDSDERTVAFMDANPATPGHALVAPREHCADLDAITDEDLAATMSAARRLTRRLTETLSPAGYNVLTNQGGAAWQTVFHFHVHVIPRYEDDPLKLPWIPGSGDAGEIARTAARIRGEEAE